MLKKITHALMALTMIGGVALTTAHDAEARRGHGIGLGIAAGIIGLGILGATAHARDRYDYGYAGGGGCYRGPRECYWAGGRCYINHYGEEVCRGGERICERRTYCD